MLELRPKGKPVEGKAPRKIGNLGFCDSTPNGIKAFSPLRKRRLQMPKTIYILDLAYNWKKE